VGAVLDLSRATVTRDTHLGVYQDHLLGARGMSEVYRACAQA